MTDKQPLGWRVDPELRERFRDFVSDKHGKTHGKLGEELEKAMREYMDDDRLARLERKVDDLSEQVEGALSENSDTHTHDTCTPHSPTAEKVDSIVDQIQSDIGTSQMDCVDEVVVRAIEEVAGADDRTVSKYREQLKRRGKMYTHPANDKRWWLSREIWVRSSYNYIQNTPGRSIGDVIEPYPIDHDEFIDAVHELDPPPVGLEEEEQEVSR